MEVTYKVILNPFTGKLQKVVDVSAMGGVANGIATLDENALVPVLQLPSVVINDTFVVSSEVDMLALTAQRGDVAIRTDVTKSFILATDSPSTLADWKELLSSSIGLAVWGGITGTLSDQTDLQTVLDTKMTDGSYYPSSSVGYSDSSNYANSAGTAYYESITNNRLAVNWYGSNYVYDGDGTALYSVFADNAQTVNDLSGHDNLELSNGASYITASALSSYVPTSRTLTMTGTTNQVTISAGSQSLAANRTWTFSLPQNIHTSATPRFAKIGIGTAASATESLTVIQSSATPSTAGNIVNTWALASDDGLLQAGGLQALVVKTGAGNATGYVSLRGLNFLAYNDGAGNVGTAAGAYGRVFNSPAGGVISNAVVFYADFKGDSGLITNYTGFYSAAQSVAGVTTGIGFHQAGASDINIFEGKVGIGSATPPRKLTVYDGGGTTDSQIRFGAGDVNFWEIGREGVATGRLAILNTNGGTNNGELFTILPSGNVGIGNTAPNTNAILDVVSTTKAFMPPRMTTTQKNAIASPTASMVVYDTVLGKLCVYGTTWETVTSI